MKMSTYHSMENKALTIPNIDVSGSSRLVLIFNIVEREAAHFGWMVDMGAVRVVTVLTEVE